jgi:peptidoglycan/LPS O-acetylase OafA/YrhL
MKSSAGDHFIALDHIRAIACFMVFTWHFTHSGGNGYPVSFDYVPSLIPFALLDEGHTGVSLFMTLSGYLFAKILNGKRINYPLFLWNRALRLLPLLSIVIFIVGIRKFINGESLSNYINTIVNGLYLPTLPNGGWSITVEFHFYMFLLPVFLLITRTSTIKPLALVIAIIALRYFLHETTGEIQLRSYFTLLGRIDQFAFGMVIFHYRQYVRYHAIAFLAVTAFMVFYWDFDSQGGFYREPHQAAGGKIWIWIPAIEGLTYAIVIAWYDQVFSHSTTWVSKFMGKIGEYSYSIYLLHVFFVNDIVYFIHTRIMNISNFYLACGWSVILFILMIIPGHLSFKFIESPFLKFRKPYFINNINCQSLEESSTIKICVSSQNR